MIEDQSPTRRALISVSDKQGIIEFAAGLRDLGFEIFSTGGTARHLSSAGIGVVDIADYTGFPEMMDGRVKTLHPKIFGGILGRLDLETDRSSMQEHGILPFQVVCVNLYPFQETIARPDVTLEHAIENIDIGGPSLIRAAAKNHPYVAVVTSAKQYEIVLNEMRSQGTTTLPTRRQLMAAAFQHTAAYDAAIGAYFSEKWGAATPAADSVLPTELDLHFVLESSLRHGENAHQAGGIYRSHQHHGPSVVQAKQLNGKQLSYNNYLDMDAALQMVRLQSLPACSVIKHNNPCGAAIDVDLARACEKAFAGDPQSAFGSVVAFNRAVDVATAEFLSANRNLFVEVIIAPGFDPPALELLTTRPKWKGNVRLMDVGDLTPAKPGWEVRTLTGGALVQTLDNQPDDPSSWKRVSRAEIAPELMRELAFGWDMVRFVKSNAITLSKDLALIGVGAGQMSRVDSVRIAIEKAGERGVGAVLASDAFFPFADSIPLAAAAGIKAIVQPGGSVNDQDVIAAADEHGIAMLFTGRRQFRH